MSSRSFLMKLLLVAICAMAVRALVLKPGVIIGKPGVLPSEGFVPQLLSRSLYEQYTLGQEEEGAQILYTYQHTQSFEDVQSEISLDFEYPYNSSNDDSVIITQIKVYVESSDGAKTQAYLTQGGIGESSISLQFVAENSNVLRYMLILFGKKN